MTKKINLLKDKVRILIHKSNKRVYLQAVNPEGLVVASEMTGGEIKDNLEGTKTAGQSLAKKLVSQKITTAVFVKGRNQYHGKIKAVVEGLREGGMKL